MYKINSFQDSSVSDLEDKISQYNKMITLEYFGLEKYAEKHNLRNQTITIDEHEFLTELRQYVNDSRNELVKACQDFIDKYSKK